MASLTHNINYLQPSGFSVVIDRKNYPNLEYFAQSVSHPGANVTETEVPFRNTTVPFSGDTVIYTDVSFNFLVDEDMQGYIEMYQWLLRNLQNNTRGASQAVRQDVPPTEADITVNILSSHNNVIRKIKYYNAFPTSIGEITLAATTNDVEPITFTSSFRFAYFEIL
jgi:hypothetical protein